MTNEEQEHIIEALEPYWIVSEISWNEEENKIELDKRNEERVIGDYPKRYKCICGEEFENIMEAEKHLEVKRN